MSFELIDSETGNVIAAFPSEEEARAHAAQLIKDAPAERDSLVMVAVDAHGHAVKSWPGSELLTA